MKGLNIGLLALVPALVGPLPSPDNVLTVGLCGQTAGATIEITFPAKETPLDGSEDSPCHSSGCHAASGRKKFDLGQ